MIENNENVVLYYVKFTHPLSSQIDFQNVAQHTGGKHGFKHRKAKLQKTGAPLYNIPVANLKWQNWIWR